MNKKKLLTSIIAVLSLVIVSGLVFFILVENKEIKEKEKAPSFAKVFPSALQKSALQKAASFDSSNSIVLNDKETLELHVSGRIADDRGLQAFIQTQIQSDNNASKWKLIGTKGTSYLLYNKQIASQKLPLLKEALNPLRILPSENIATLLQSYNLIGKEIKANVNNGYEYTLSFSEKKLAKEKIESSLLENAQIKITLYKNNLLKEIDFQSRLDSSELEQFTDKEWARSDYADIHLQIFFKSWGRAVEINAKDYLEKYKKTPYEKLEKELSLATLPILGEVNNSNLRKILGFN